MNSEMSLEALFSLDEIVAEAQLLAKEGKKKQENSKLAERQLREKYKEDYLKEKEEQKKLKLDALGTVKYKLIHFIRENWLLAPNTESPFIAFAKFIEAHPEVLEDGVKVIFSFSKGGERGNYYIEIQNLPAREIVYADEVEKALVRHKQGLEVKLI